MYLFLKFIPDSSVQSLQQEFEIKCVKSTMESYSKKTGSIYLGLDYWDARRMQHLVINKNFHFIPISAELNYLDWMAKKENYEARINYVYLDIHRSYNFGSKSVKLLKDKCGDKHFYQVESK
jgi:hypothetical protein